MQSNFIKEHFSRVPQIINFSLEEEKVLEYWKNEKVFENCLEQSKNQPRFNFYDGPPFATGLPHYGHILTSTIKDVVTRYAHQKGYHVPRRFGWDCHGLPVEYEIDTNLGIRGPEDVTKIGIAAYNKECRKIVMRYATEWEEVVTRMGRWIDFHNDYKTMYPWYMESVWWVFKQLYEKGLVYQGVKVMPYSTACTTPLSNFESGQNYKIVVDPNIIVALPITDSNEADNFLICTTTPWTLPSNLAICVNPKVIYAKVLDLESNKIVILAECRLEKVFKNSSQYQVIETFVGESLKNWKYMPVFKYFEEYGNRMNAFRVLLDDYVACDSGTGIVHLAPYFGEDDYRVCFRDGIISRDSEIICPVDDSGRFSEIVTDFSKQYIKDADKNIILYLKECGYLFQEGQIKHSYPFCWRSDTPLIYKAIPAWFIRVEEMSTDLLRCNKTTNWIPDFVRDKRFGNWLKDARDWAVSRNRYWGTPIPIWMSATGDEIICVGSIDELANLSGKRIEDLHRESVDHIEIPSQIHGNLPLRRIPDVFDCWFESGSMPYAQHHYPFENQKEFQKLFPGEFIAEGIDQTRGWFYTLLVISTALYKTSPYKNVIVNGLVLASDGQKMSKRKKNYPDPLEIMNKYGADALRLYLINSPVVRGENLRFEEAGVKDVIKNILLPWYNSYRLLILNIVSLEKEGNFKYFYNKERQEAKIGIASIMDVWIVSLKESLLEFLFKEMKEYRLYAVVPKLINFFNQLTKWYIRLNRKRIKGEIDKDQAIQSIDTLFDVLLTMVTVMAPITPFLSEYLYQRLKLFLTNEQDKVFNSIHYIMMPKLNRNYIRCDIEIAVSKMQSVIELGRIIRDRRAMSLKFPIKHIIVVNKDQLYLHDIKNLEDIILRELNVRKLTTSTEREKYGVALKAEPNYEKLRGRLGKNFKEIAQLIRMLNNDFIEKSLIQKSFNIMGFTFNADEIQLKYSINKDLVPPEFESNTDGSVVVFMDMTQTEELSQEGYAREIINRIQKLKKQALLVPTDNVYIFYTFIDEKNSKLKSIAEKYKELIESTIKSPFLELFDCKIPCILEQLIDINNELIRISISKEDHRFPVIPWVNVILADDRLSTRYLRNNTRKGCILIQNRNEEYLTVDHLKHEIEALFGLYNCNFILLCNNLLPLLNVDFTTSGKTIFVKKSLERTCDPSIDEAFIHPFCKFLNCQLNNKKFTIFLENPKNNELYKDEVTALNDIGK